MKQNQQNQPGKDGTLRQDNRRKCRNGEIHNLRFAVEYGNRLLMMHQGHAVMDKKGEEKANTKVDDILDMFNAISIECGN